MLHIEVSTADVIDDGVIVDHEGTITLLWGAVGAEGGVVGLNHSCGNPGGRTNGGEPRTCPPSKADESQES